MVRACFCVTFSSDLFMINRFVFLKGKVPDYENSMFCRLEQCDDNMEMPKFKSVWVLFTVLF